MSELILERSTPVLELQMVPPSSPEAAQLASVVTGPSGSAASLSQDPGNRSTLGADGGIYTPDLVGDPLAYYILSKN